MILSAQSAQSQGKSKTTKKSVVKTTKKKPFQYQLVLDWGTNLEKENNSTKEDGSLYIAPAYKFDNNLKLGTTTYLIHENYDEQRTYTSNTTLRLSYDKFQLGPVGFTPSVAVVLPTDLRAKKENTFEYALATRALFTGKILGLSTAYFIDYKQNQHQTTINKDRQFNIQSVLTQYTSLTKDFGNVASLNLEFVYRIGSDYNNNTSNSFIAAQELSFPITKNLSFEFGHSNEAPALKADGQTSNLKLFSERTSRLYTSLTLKN